MKQGCFFSRLGCDVLGAVHENPFRESQQDSGDMPKGF
jgi:hypothetical protein